MPSDARLSGDEWLPGLRDVRLSGDDWRPGLRDVRSSGDDWRPGLRDVRLSGDDWRPGLRDVRSAGDDWRPGLRDVRSSGDDWRPGLRGVCSSGDDWRPGLRDAPRGAQHCVRVLALDYGSARCGCALSDPTGTLATPIEPVLRPATRKGLARIVDIVREREAQCVVVGLPLSLSGADSAQTAETRAFAARLAERLAVPVELYDERFTTRMASRDPGEPRSSEDSRAAAHLLEGWLAAHEAGEAG